MFTLAYFEQNPDAVEPVEESPQVIAKQQESLEKRLLQQQVIWWGNTVKISFQRKEKGKNLRMKPTIALEKLCKQTN